ncbi:MAG: UDP-N-acetylmuramate dehydrogenase [Bacteroidota bacterium]
MIEYNYPLLRHNSFGLDVVAERFFGYSTDSELKDFLRYEYDPSTRMLHIGGGNNLLFTDDFRGTILHSSIKYISIESETDDNVFVRVGAGVVFDNFCRQAVECNWGGVENLSLIPSQVGAAAIQNIGAYGAEAKDTIVEVDAIEIATGKRRTFGVEECKYGYRSSIFKTALEGQFVVVSVLFRLDKHPKPNIEYAALRDFFDHDYTPNIEEVRDAVVSIRQSKLPDLKRLGNAGSFFKNPYCNRADFERLRRQYDDMPHYDVSDDLVKIPAAYLIEKCGLKGKRIGNVGIYDRQPLVIVNYGGAKPREIIALADEIRQSVRRKFDIDLMPEVIYV